MGRKDNSVQTEFLWESLQAFLANKDLEQMSVSTDFGQIAVSRAVKKKGEVHAIGFQNDPEEDDEDEYEDDE